MKLRKSAIVFWALYGFAALTVLSEAAMPAWLSVAQSDWIASIFENLINAVTPRHEAVPVYPTGISLAPSNQFCEEDEAILGTTKVLNYSLSYENLGKNSVKYGNVKITRTDGSDNSVYTVSLSSNQDGGTVRITGESLAEHCSFLLEDDVGNQATYEFSVIPRKAPEEIDFSFPATLSIGETCLMEGTLSYPGITDTSGETSDHYLRRYFDPTEITLTSSDPSVLEAGDGYVKALQPGTANLFYGAKQVASITVTNNVLPSGTISLDPPSDPTVHLLDYDFSSEEGYALPLSVSYSSPDMDKTIRWTSSDPLVAMVTNEHYDNNGNLIPGGIVSGYRKAGTATIRGTLISDPTQAVELEVTSNAQLPLEASFSLTYQGAVIAPGTRPLILSGESLSLRASCLPKNALQTAIEVSVSSEEVLKIAGNRSSNVTIIAQGKGIATIEAHLVANPSLTCQAEVEVELAPTITEENRHEVQLFTRKSIGHFTLFAITTMLAVLAFYFTFKKEKPLREVASAGFALGAGVVLAFLSEAIQMIPPLHRGPSLFDVMIDSAGAFAMAVFLLVLLLLIRWIRYLKRKSKAN